MGATVALAGCAQPEPEIVCDTDAITTRSLTDLRAFTDWLDEHNVDGMIGEAGWPGPANGTDAADWAILANRWLKQAQAAELPVYVWAAAPWWPEDYPLGFYRGVDPSEDLTYAAPQAELFERYLADGLPGGVNLAEATFGAPINTEGDYASGNSGELFQAYTYPSRNSLTYLADRGITSTRFAVLWERLQPEPYGPLDPVEVDRVRAVFHFADEAGIDLVLDVHNFARYVQGDDDSRTVLRIGDPELPGSALADLWTKLATEFHQEPALSGYDLMNEPFDLPGGAATWEQASLETAEAIRQIDAERPLWIEGYDWAGAHVWTKHHDEPWVPSSLNPVVYQAHQYWDASYAGAYENSYGEENAAIEAAGSPCRPQ